MFTGLVEHMGRIAASAATPAGRRLEIDPCGWMHRPAPGESIAINGCCLTIADGRAEAGGVLMFDVVPETLAKTTLGGLAGGAYVNLERSATPATLLGGHLLQGHVDGMGVVAGIQTAGQHRIRIAVGDELIEYITPKGSIAIEGVSLTVAGVEVGVGVGGQGDGSGKDAGWFEVALIPTTLAKTTLGGLEVGQRVNIETDIVGRTVVHWLRHFGADRS
ncbi:MAG: riboflavin synthase [Phycisphaerales bacterium]|nr:riboflavin synthase [Phycisphaerales bacterium]